MSRPRVDVGVVTWNTGELTATALRRLLDHDQGADLRVLVHDNHSADGTTDAIAAAVPEAEVVAGTENLGFGAGMNRIIARSTAPWFLALNPDAWPEPGAIGRLVAAAEADPRIGAVAPRLERPDGSLEHSTHPFPSVFVGAVMAAQGHRWLPPRVADRLYLEPAWDHRRPRDVPWAVGAALLFRRRALDEVGGFDADRFFMYVEDLEWCHRARRHGWSIRFEPAAVVVHVGNASGAQKYGDSRTATYLRNTNRWYRDERGPARTALYRAVNAAGATVQARLARRRGDDAAAAWWRQIRAVHLEPVPDADPSRPAVEPDTVR